MDTSADFYLESVDQVFQRHPPPLGQMTHKGHAVVPKAIRKTFLLTVEGEKDDIRAVGQTLAAQDLCSGLRPYMKRRHLAAGRRLLRRLQRPALGDAGLSGAAQPHPLGAVTIPAAPDGRSGGGLLGLTFETDRRRDLYGRSRGQCRSRRAERVQRAQSEPLQADLAAGRAARTGSFHRPLHGSRNERSRPDSWGRS
jgi:hypothetical protein